MNADGFSSLPLHLLPGVEASVDAACYNLGQIQTLPVIATKLGTCSRQDLEVSRVMHYTLNEWLASVLPELKSFYSRRELTIEGNCLLWWVRVVVPIKLRQKVLNDLHHDHVGMIRMKAIAQSYMWWPGMDSEIENLAKSCVLSC